MEKTIKKLADTIETVKEKAINSSGEEDISYGTKIKTRKKELNSWDCSTTASTDRKTPKDKNNDWDSSSDCHETMVEPFENVENGIANEYDNWDSESEKNSVKKCINVGGKEVKPNAKTSYESLDLPSIDLSDTDKSSLNEIFSVSTNQKAKGGCLRSANNDLKSCKDEKDLLLVEDLEELLKNEDHSKSETIIEQESIIASDLGSNFEVENESSLNTEDKADTTIWMIPESEKTLSTDSNKNLVPISDTEKNERLEVFKVILKKSKSLSDLQCKKNKKKLVKPSKSDCERNYDLKSVSVFPIDREFLNLKENPEARTQIKIKKSCSGNFDTATTFFSEYECRIITMEKNEAVDKNNFKSSENDTSEVKNETTHSDRDDNRDDATENLNTSNNNNKKEYEVAGPSTLSYLDAVSLPDMLGKNSYMERGTKDKLNRRKNSSVKAKTEKQESKGFTNATVNKVPSGSWYLLDDKGQYQEVSRNEVSILLNGKSADAVLQSKKCHVISNTNLEESSKDSVCGITKESLENFLREEDFGGEDQLRQGFLNDLDRKVENTLFCIQPTTNLTRSIKFIPVDTEMIHIWRAAKDNGSFISSEDDLIFRSSHVSMESQKNVNDHQSSNKRNLTNLTTNESFQQTTSGGIPITFSLQNEVLKVNSSTQESQVSECLNICFETRMLVNTLAHNFTTLQSRLDGETKRNALLQGEVKKLKDLLSEYKAKMSTETSGEYVCERCLYRSNPPSYSSISTIHAENNSNAGKESIVEKHLKDYNYDCTDEIQVSVELEPTQEEKVKSECPGNSILKLENNLSYITGQVRESSTHLNSNLIVIEEKMKHLEERNEILTKQNTELKKKLEEISFELEIYLSTTSDLDSSDEDENALDLKRDQVCNLKLEQDNLKKIHHEKVKIENVVLREQLLKKALLLEEWITATTDVFREIENSKQRLHQNGIVVDLNYNLEGNITETSSNSSKILISYIKEATECIIMINNKNLVYEQTFKETLRKENNGNHYENKMSRHNDQYIKYFGESENKMIEDYVAVMMEKASLVEEIKLLKTENEMLAESQLKYYEKLKQTMIALKDQKSDLSALESSQKLVEIEKVKLQEVLKSYEEEKESMKTEILRKTKSLQELTEDLKNKELIIIDYNEKIKAATNEIKNFEKSCKLKDNLINELKMENSQLLSTEGMTNNRIEILKDEFKNLEMQKNQLESELSSTKVFLNQSQKETTEYITHLEAIINNCQDALDKNKQKLKESNQVLTRLKNENEILEKQHQCDLKLYNKTKDELESCKESVLNISNKYKQSEEEKEKLCKKLEILLNSDKEKSEALNETTREYKMLLSENAGLKEKMEIFSKDKDESLKEQKDLINKYAMLSKEVQRLQEKYRNVKTECNERTNLIKYLEMMLKENLIEYNNRIACLENNISHILDKIAACKKCIREKHAGGDAEVRELRHQLDVSYQEKKDLETVVNDYYSALKHLENEVHEKEKKVGELHVKLSLEQKKSVEYEGTKKPFHSRAESLDKHFDFMHVQKLENQITQSENELLECRKQMQQSEINHENEKKKLELTIADLKSEISRYQMRIEIMMRNFASTNKNLKGPVVDNSNIGGTIKEIKAMAKEVEEKNKKIMELNETIKKYEVEIRMKDSVVDNSNRKSFCLDEDVRSLQSQLSKMQDALIAANKNTEIQQREKNELADKLLESVKLIAEERSAMQTFEKVTLEKEKSMKEEMARINNELALKVKEYEALFSSLERKKKFISKLQSDIRKMKKEISFLKEQITSYEKSNKESKETGDYIPTEEILYHSNSPTYVKSHNVSPERLESCVRELKEIRNINLQLRKTEGQFQAKIVCLEDEIRDSRLLIKELQGDIKTEKKSKKALKDMITSAKMEIEACLLSKQLTSDVADRLNRHLNLSEIPSRELLSDFRLRGHSNSSKIY